MITLKIDFLTQLLPFLDLPACLAFRQLRRDAFIYSPRSSSFCQLSFTVSIMRSEYTNDTPMPTLNPAAKYGNLPFDQFVLVRPPIPLVLITHVQI